MIIARSYEISAGHHLPLHEGKCREPHGHNYIIEVAVQGPLQEEGSATGMVMDFADLDRVVKQYLNVIDHVDLNELEDRQYLRYDGTTMNEWIMPPTAENICTWLFSSLLYNFPIYSASVEGKVQLNRVRVYETRNSWVEMTR